MIIDLKFMSRKCDASILETFPEKESECTITLFKQSVVFKEETPLFKWYIEVCNYSLSTHCELIGLYCYINNTHIFQCPIIVIHRPIYMENYNQMHLKRLLSHEQKTLFHLMFHSRLLIFPLLQEDKLFYCCQNKVGAIGDIQFFIFYLIFSHCQK